jgi:hypothetical protein
MLLGIALTPVWILAKAVFSSAAIWYLRRRTARQYQDAAPAAAVIV